MEPVDSALAASLTASVAEDPDGTAVLTLRGEFDIASAPTVRQHFESLLAARDAARAGASTPAEANVVVDMSDLTFMDSSGLAVLLSAVNRGCVLTLRRPTTIIRDLIAATGLGQVLPVETSAAPASEHYPNDPASVAAARAFVATELSDMRDEVRNRAVLITSELATNALQHARTPFLVTVAVGADEARVAVTDEGGAVPVPRDPQRTDTDGRGLMILRALSDDWGIDIAPESTTVWFTLSD